MLSDNEYVSRLENVYSQTVPDDGSYHAILHEEGNVMLDNLTSLSQIDTKNYYPENGALYPSSLYGTQLRQTAQLINEGIGLEVATVSIGGYDNHVNQGGAIGNQAALHADFSTGIAALYDDLGPVRMNDVLILTISEFGRTAKSNASGGSDHGNASAWLVI